MQLVGSVCGVCGLPINFAPEGHYCKQCQQAYHRQCLAKSAQCPQCKRNIAHDFEEAEAYERRSHEAQRLGFNWGAFLIPPIWMLGHRFWIWGLAYVIIAVVCVGAEIPGIVGILNLVCGIYFGIRGNKKLWAAGRYASVQDLKRKEKRWAIFGLITTIVAILTIMGLIAWGLYAYA